MDPVEQAFNEYVAGFNAGNFDPRPFTGRFEGAERTELELLIDSFIEEAPAREYSEDAYRDSGAKDMAASVLEDISGVAGQWPVLLPELRNRQQMRRTEVVEALARDFEADPEETEKIGLYLHDMEWGTLPASGVSSRVIEALSRIFKTKAEVLARAGRALGPPSGSSGPVFSRMPSDQEFVVIADQESAPVSRTADPPDRIDQLFTSGD